MNAIDRNTINTSFFANQQIYYRIDNEHPLIKSNIRNVKKIRAKNNCWICEGWKELKFSYKPPTKIKNPKEMEVKLHLNFENYSEWDTDYMGDEFISYRMCPPGDVLFYFTVNKIPVESYGAATFNLEEHLTYVNFK